MALYADLAGGCATMVKYLNDLTKSNSPFLLGRKTGALDFLTNPMNGSVKLDLNNVQMGKKYVKTKLHYKVRTKPCEILTDDSVGDVCDTAAEPVEESVDVTITKRVGTSPKKFTNANMINICQDTKSFIDEYVVSDMRALREKIDEIALALLEAGAGVNYEYDGTETAAGSSKTLQILGTDSTIGTQVPLYANFTQMLNDYQNNQLNGVPHIIGQGNLQQFYALKGFTCCNADGVAYDSAVASGAAFYLDQAANSVLGSNEALVIAPNVSHLLWFNENHNININTPTAQHIVVPDPVYPGLKWDLDFKWDECEKAWIYKLSTWFDVFNAIQTDAFGAADVSSPICEDELVGMTGIFKYKFTATA